MRREDSKGRATGKGTWTNRKETSEWNGISEESRPWTVAEPDVKSAAVSNNRDEGQQRYSPILILVIFLFLFLEVLSMNGLLKIPLLFPFKCRQRLR